MFRVLSQGRAGCNLHAPHIPFLLASRFDSVFEQYFWPVGKRLRHSHQTRLLCTQTQRHHLPRPSLLACSPAVTILTSWLFRAALPCRRPASPSNHRRADCARVGYRSRWPGKVAVTSPTCSEQVKQGLENNAQRSQCSNKSGV